MTDRQAERFARDPQEIIDRFPAPCQACEYVQGFARRENAVLNEPDLSNEWREATVRNVFDHSTALWQVCNKALAFNDKDPQASDTTCNMTNKQG